MVYTASTGNGRDTLLKLKIYLVLGLSAPSVFSYINFASIRYTFGSQTPRLPPGNFTSYWQQPRLIPLSHSHIYLPLQLYSISSGRCGSFLQRNCQRKNEKSARFPRHKSLAPSRPGKPSSPLHRWQISLFYSNNSPFLSEIPDFLKLDTFVLDQGF